MKTKIFGIVILLVMTAMSVYSQDKKEIRVSGNCGMCESRIEKAAKAVEGVSEADWNKETKILSLSFDPAKTSLEKIRKAVVAVGHDSGDLKADNEVYNKLPGCCKYREE